LLIELARAKQFTDTFEIPTFKNHLDKDGEPTQKLKENKYYKRMLDCEIVLRFFAFRKKSNLRGSVKAMLDRVMEENMDSSEAQIETFRKEFLERLATAVGIFGANAFRYTDENGKVQLSIPLFDGVMVAIDRNWDKKSNLLNRRATIQKNVQKLINDETSFEVIVGKPNTAKAVAKRLDILTEAMGA
jgi:hypothetical protein